MADTEIRKSSGSGGEKPIGTVTAKVYKTKPVEVEITGEITGTHIPRIKRMVTLSYLKWVKGRRIK